MSDSTFGLLAFAVTGLLPMSMLAIATIYRNSLVSSNHPTHQPQDITEAYIKKGNSSNE